MLANADRQIYVSEIISALSYALDLTEGQAPGHSVRSCILGMRIAQEIKMPIDQQADLYYALLLKDAGCSSNASKLFHIIGTDERVAKHDVKFTDWTKVGWESLEYAITHVHTNAPFIDRVRKLYHVAATQQESSKQLVQIRCDRGAQIARRLGFSEAVAAAIYSLDEHWNGIGYPLGLRGENIPLFARILNLAQSIDVFQRARGVPAALNMVRQRSGRWFDPQLVKAVESATAREGFWAGLDDATSLATAIAMEPQQRVLALDDDRIDSICLGFADVIDAKTPFTYRHSNGVADTALRIAGAMSLDSHQLKFLRRAALLHDIGKLCVPNSILEKPGKLDNDEWAVVKKHPARTLEILNRIPGFSGISEIAAAHHEKLDGTGYFRGWDASRMPLEARILVVSDIFDALAAKRPYRDAMPLEQVFGIMERDAPHALDADCVSALKTAKLGRDHTADVAELTTSLRRLSQTLTEENDLCTACVPVESLESR